MRSKPTNANKSFISTAEAKTAAPPSFRITRVFGGDGLPRVVSTERSAKPTKYKRVSLSSHGSPGNAEPAQLRAVDLALEGLEGTMGSKPTNAKKSFISTAEARTAAPPSFRIARVFNRELPYVIDTKRSANPTKSKRVSASGHESPENYRRPVGYKTHFLEIVLEAEPKVQTALDAFRDSKAARSLALREDVWRSAEWFRIRIGTMELHSVEKVNAARELVRSLKLTDLMPRPLHYNLGPVTAFCADTGSRLKTGICTSPEDESGTLRRLAEDIRREFSNAGFFDKTSTPTKNAQLSIPLVNIAAPKGKGIELWDPIVKDEKLANMKFGKVAVKSVGVYKIPRMQHNRTAPAAPAKASKVVEAPLVPRLPSVNNMRKIESRRGAYKPMVLLPNTDTPEPFSPEAASELAPKALETGNDGVEASSLSESAPEATLASPVEDVRRTPPTASSTR